MFTHAWPTNFMLSPVTTENVFMFMVCQSFIWALALWPHSCSADFLWGFPPPLPSISLTSLALSPSIHLQHISPSLVLSFETASHAEQAGLAFLGFLCVFQVLIIVMYTVRGYKLYVYKSLSIQNSCSPTF